MAKNAKSWVVFEKEDGVSNRVRALHLVDLNEIYKILEKVVLERTRTPTSKGRKFALFHFSLKLKSTSNLPISTFSTPEPLRSPPRPQCSIHISSNCFPSNLTPLQPCRAWRDLSIPAFKPIWGVDLVYYVGQSFLLREDLAPRSTSLRSCQGVG